MSENYQVSIPLSAGNLAALTALGRDFDIHIQLDLQPNEIEVLRQAGTFDTFPNYALVYKRQHSNGLINQLEFFDVSENIDSILTYYADENPDTQYDSTLDTDQFPMDLAFRALKLTAMLTNPDGRIDPEANGTTVSALMAELGITPEQIFAVSVE